MARYINIHIEVPGDPKDPIDTTEYLNSFLRQQNAPIICFYDGTILSVDSSLLALQPIRGMVRQIRSYLRRCKISFLDSVSTKVYEIFR